MEHELLVGSSWAIAIVAIITLIVTSKKYAKQNQIAKEQNEISKKYIEYQGILEVMKIFNNDNNAHQRDLLYKNYREKTLYTENGKFKTEALQHMAASVRGMFDNFGKLVKEGYINKEQFLSMYCGSVIRMYKVLQPHIEFERSNRPSKIFAINFEEIFNDSKAYWQKHFSDTPEPEPY